VRLVHAHVENFKLLKDVKLDFSTEAQHPLTVVRAENGSGKTSLLYALLWAFYGDAGLPKEAAGLRLGPAYIPAGDSIDVRVMIEFVHTDDAEIESKYRLVRSVRETAGVGDKVDRGPDRVRLLRITVAGEEDLPSADALIGKFIPLRLRDIFFTNGDDVQTYISGKVGDRQRQSQVHTAIKMLLGLDALRTAAEDIDAAFKKFRSDAAQSGGSDTSKLEVELERIDAELRGFNDEEAHLTESLKNMSEAKTRWEKELSGLRGIGDLEELNARIAAAEIELRTLRSTRGRSITRMRDLLKSEAASWALLSEYLGKGVDALAELADRKVIPGTSLQVLDDRLELGECICGESLADDSEHRRHVLELREEQQRVSESQQRLTKLFHEARQAAASEEARIESNEDFAAHRNEYQIEFTQVRDALTSKYLELEQLKERRAAIDEEKVRDLTDKLRALEGKIANANIEMGRVQSAITDRSGRKAEQENALEDAERATRVSQDLALKRDVSKDILDLASKALKTLEGDYVERVSDRMNQLFMGIVGAAPEFEAGVFRRVYIDPAFNIKVDTHDGRTLDTDFELNGASQRALTLAFIWALMEVSGTTAPRIIDTPLGMVAGGVKTRMVDKITDPGDGSTPDFQVVLLLTRSEVRDVEDLLDERAGVVRTLSNSKDYPEDLVHPWHVDHPVSRMCTCTHRQSCRICARRYDEQHGIKFRDEEAAV
jgi:DNA sulfur modification protein DndD